MTENELEFIRIIRESDDPAKAAAFVTDMLTRFLLGESIESIAISYGLALASV